MCVIVKNVWNIWIFAQKTPEFLIFWRENSKLTSVILTSKYFCWCSSKYFMAQKSILGPDELPLQRFFLQLHSRVGHNPKMVVNWLCSPKTRGYPGVKSNQIFLVRHFEILRIIKLSQSVTIFGLGPILPHSNYLVQSFSKASRQCRRTGRAKNGRKFL